MRRVYLTGYSATSQTTYDFYNYHHTVTRLANGAPVFDGYLPLGRIVLLAPERDAVLVSLGTQSDYLARFRDSTPAERASRAPRSAAGLERMLVEGVPAQGRARL